MRKISKVNVNFKLQARNQSVVKAIFYITPVRSSAVLSNTNIDLRHIPIFLKTERKKPDKTKNTHTQTTVKSFTITTFKLRRVISQ